MYTPFDPRTTRRFSVTELSKYAPDVRALNNQQVLLFNACVKDQGLNWGLYPSTGYTGGSGLVGDAEVMQLAHVLSFMRPIDKENMNAFLINDYISFGLVPPPPLGD